MTESYHPFPPTQWTLIDRARRPATAGKPSEALAQLLERYRPALASYLIFARHIPAEKADDLLQEFITEKLLDGQTLGHAESGRGRFRSFLLTSLQNFLVSDFRRQSALKRGNGQSVSIENIIEPTDPGQGPQEAADLDWARTLLQRAVDQMRQECLEHQREEVWKIFQARVLEPILGGYDPPAYEVLVEQFGLSSPSQASNLLVTGKRMLARSLRKLVEAYEPDPERVEREILDLGEILARGRSS